MTRHLDPERSPELKFFPFPIDIETGVCNRCSSLVPMTDVAKQNHRGHHAQIDALAGGFASVALASQLSGSGSRTATSTGATADASPDPDPKSPPTPPQEATAGRGGAEGSNQGTDAAGVPLLPGSVTEGPAVFPPAAGPTKGSRPASSPGKDAAGRLHLPEEEPPDYGRFAR